MQALDGLRVIDMATVFAGPGAARYLADFGADVIKVEAPSGDGVRRMGWFPPEGGDSYTWKLLGRGKRGVVLDLKTDDGRDALLRARRRRRRARSRTSGPARSSGSVSAPTCCSRATRGLVVLRVTGFGQDGPYAARPGLRDDRRGDERLRRDQRRARRRRRCCRRSRSPTRSPRSRARSR